MCTNCVLQQTYKNFKILFVDDASDYTRKQINIIQKKLKDHVTIFNRERKFSIHNAYTIIHEYAENKSSVILLLDADDWLVDRNTLAYIFKVYQRKDILFTYGNCFFWDGRKYMKSYTPFSQYLNTAYPKNIIKKRLFRYEHFRISHPMTFKTSFFKLIKENDFKEENGVWLKYEFDLATFLPMLEMANGKFALIKRRLSVYNISSPNLNIKKNPYEFAREELIIRKKKVYGSIV